MQGPLGDTSDVKQNSGQGCRDGRMSGYISNTLIIYVMHITLLNTFITVFLLILYTSRISIYIGGIAFKYSD